MKTPHSLPALLITVLLMGALSSLGQPAGKPPNILLILVDDLGYGDLSSYGAQHLRTPNIDALVQGGMRFDNFYANCPVCSPTRAALLSGKYPDLVGVPGVIRTHPKDNWGYLSARATLLPQILATNGYHTALVGKWHLGLQSPNTPIERGFHAFHGFLGDMMDDYYHHRRHDHNYMRHNQEIINPAGHATDLFTQWAVDYLATRKALNQPFFLYLAYNAPHTPIQPPPDWLKKVQEREPGINPTRARLVALIEHLDEGIGKVLDSLRANGQTDNTLILFTSDNGGQIDAGADCGPFRGGKQDTYEGGIRVPMCATWPHRIAPGSRSDQVALTMDLFPTVCEAAHIKIANSINGLSLLPILLEKEKQLPNRDLFWVRREGGARYQGQDYYALRRGDWKLVHNHPFERCQLYNLKADPLEQNDLSQSEKDMFNQLSAALRQQIQRAGSVPWQAP